MIESRFPWPIETITERAATDADCDPLWRVHVDAMRSYVATTYGWDDAVQYRLFREGWDGRRAQRVLVDDGVVVGSWLVARRSPDRADAWMSKGPAVEDEVFLASIEVASTHQRKGLGSVIVRRTLEDGERLRLPVRLTVMKTNPDARRLYERLGFAIEGETSTHVRMVARP